jgi:hypothetical protein
MSLTYRPTKPADLRSCFELASDRGAYGSAAEQGALLGFWEHLLESKVGLSRVVEDRTLSAGKRILGFVLSVFVTDEFRDEIKAAFGPHVGRQVYRRRRSGRPAFLSRREIALRNSHGGLNLLVISHGTAPTSAPDGDLRVRARMFEAFIECHGGYVIQELVQEVFGPEERAGALALGWKLVRDLAAPRPAPEATSAGEPGSALIGLHRDACRFPNPLWGMFYSPQPRFQFSDVEKDVLEAALCNGTDEEISRNLDISIWTIKKRWQKVYAKVDRVIPDLLQPSIGAEATALDSRGGQRRRHLLDYLRQLPHELRPTVQAGRARSKIEYSRPR